MMGPSHYQVPDLQRGNARRMRRKMTDAELKLWNELRAHRLMGLGFRRQYPIASFVVDFACPEYRLIIELDGTQHAQPDAVRGDEARTRKLETDNWTVLRFWNHEVLEDIDNVCAHIVAWVEERK